MSKYLGRFAITASVKMGLVRRKNDAHEVHSELKLVIIQSCCLSDGRRRVDDTDLKSAFLDKTRKRTCTYTDTYADTVTISDTITVKSTFTGYAKVCTL